MKSEETWGDEAISIGFRIADCDSTIAILASQSQQLLPQILEEFLDPGEEPFAFRVGAAVLAFLFEFAQQLLLPLAQIDRGFDDRLDEHVAAGRRAPHAHPLRSKPELGGGR